MPSIWGASLEEHRALVLERLLDAFAALVRERGLEGTTLAAVAERAGLARTAVYNHVRDKHDLLLAHTERALVRATGELEAELAPEGSAEERLERYIRVAFTSWAAEPAAGADVMPLLDDEQRTRLMQHLAPMRVMLQQIVDEGITTGVFRPLPRDELVGFITATLEGYRMAIGRGQLDAARAATTVHALLLHGLSGRSERPDAAP